MSHPLSLLALGRPFLLTNAGGSTATVPAYGAVVGVSAYSAAGGTIVITPAGANMTGVALATITVPAGVAYDLPWLVALPAMGPGTILVFSSVDAYVVACVIQKVG